MDYDLLVKILKRKYRSVDVPSSFRSRMFHAPVKGCFFSVKCFKLLFGKNYIKKVGPGINRANLVKELDDLLEKYTKEDDELEEDEEDGTITMTSDTEDNSNEVRYLLVKHIQLSNIISSPSQPNSSSTF